MGRYDKLVDSISSAGFYTTRVENMGSWDRITICSQRLPGPCYTGNSFWVSKLGVEWFVGTWGGSIYRVKSETVLIHFVVEWLTLEPTMTAFDISIDVQDKYGLEPVKDSAFLSILKQQRK
jgi:hypothetical protein